MDEGTREKKIAQLKVEIFDLIRERDRVNLSVAKINQVIQGKGAELEKLENTPDLKVVPKQN